MTLSVTRYVKYCTNSLSINTSNQLLYNQQYVYNYFESWPAEPAILSIGLGRGFRLESLWPACVNTRVLSRVLHSSFTPSTRGCDLGDPYWTVYQTAFLY